MIGYFVWCVKGEAAHPDAVEYRGLEFHGKMRVDPTGEIAYARKPFECMVLTQDPCGADVADLALAMRIGPPPRARTVWEAVVTSMECIGWAQGAEEQQS